jgi:uncharacterized protein YbaR (Trm112 family)
MLACPQTKAPLTLCTALEAEARIGAPLVPRGELRNASGRISKPCGKTDTVLLREDLRCAYPVVDGIPILLAPEQLTPQSSRQTFDLRDPQYAEAYEEMEYYDQVASEEVGRIRETSAYQIVSRVMPQGADAPKLFPHPKEMWVDMTYDCAAQWDAYSHLAPIEGKRFVQLGGMGIQAVKMLIAGAAEAWVVTPMLAEMRCALALAAAVGVENRLRCAVAVAEELPLISGSIDAILAAGCLHHMTSNIALPEIARVLRPGGRFAAVEPWRAPLYAIGTKLLGKREPAVYCRPLTPARVAPLRSAFTSSAVIHHGALTRYPLLALTKFRIESRLSVVWGFNRIDDAFCGAVGLRGMGSSVAVLGTK